MAVKGVLSARLFNLIYR
ncbi:hypothetical protein ACLB1R_11715 [Escherichia coli]